MALLGAALTSAACYGAGALLIGRLHLRLGRAEHLPLAFVLGAACLHLAIFAILAAHLAYWPVLVALLLAVILAWLRWSSLPPATGTSVPASPRTLKHLSVLLFALFTLLYFFHAWAPEASPDGSSYHLGFIARYLRAHAFEPITNNMYAALSGGVDLLFLPAFAIGRHSAGALVHFAFLLALTLAILAYGRRIGKPWAGAAAAFLVYASPVVGIDGTSAYNDVAVAAIVFSVFYWLEIWDEHRDSRALIPVGLLAGYAYAAKYTAFVMLFYALGFVLWRARSLRPAAKVAALSFVMVAPWMLKDWITLRNPVAPFGNQIFRNPYFHVMFEQEYTSYLRRYDIANLWTLPLEVTVRGQKTAGIVGPVFLLAPVALLALRYRAGRRLLAAGLVVFGTYFANVGTRFLIPMLPFLALAMALAVVPTPRPLPDGRGSADTTEPRASASGQTLYASLVLAALMIVHAATSWPGGIERYAPGSWSLSPRILYKQALRIVPQDRYLRESNPSYGVARMVEQYVPKGERVLSFSGIADAYTSREILVSYEAALNEDLIDIVNTGWIDAYQPRVIEQFKFPERAIRRIRVEQTALGQPLEQWSVHELRFLHGGVELPRRPEWRLSAWPNPWDVQMAFDNSPATRWRTWERAAPGDYLQVDFGQAQVMDEVRIERSYDYNNLQIQVKMFDEAGTWRKIADHPVASPIQPDANIRRAATHELQAAGIHYLLVSDETAGADDLRGDPEGWGLAQVAQGYGARLYRTAR